ncbi:SpaH/EbpB family LPXTG-anchored major pilin [Bifidobacterium pseudolongum]|uniref:SpaH/EbpB family LPXTG-anchored major pilin n=1 Tax=Bifidobacterium pseudolongum TaxID=1694 RepID=UPI0010CEB552|nr:SpaH/EbpB family LPXTG-anchored major pilin [Bifidobacterium pseudolongum]RYQ66188.1 fimbrial subunit-like cell surface protein [Bifidobacterium pseudolongum subsp. globosum]
MNLKRVFAGVAAAATMLGGLALGATTANAETIEIAPTGTITVNNAQMGHTYTPYLFATFSNAQTVDGKTYVDIDTVPAMVATVRNAAAAANGDASIPTEYTNNPAAYVATFDAQQLRQFADELTKSLTGGSGKTPTTDGANMPISNLATGWYAITDTSDGATVEGATAIVATPVNSTTTLVVNPKGDGQGTIQATGSYNAKSADAMAPTNVTKKVNDTDIHDGQLITYTVTATIPAAAAGYEFYGFQFADTADQGLAVDTDSVKVVNGEGATVTPDTVTLANNKLTVKIQNAKQYAGQTLTMTYDATPAFGTVDTSNTLTNTVQADAFLSLVAFNTGTTPDASSTSATVTVKTHDVTFTKVGVGDDAAGLAGAQFAIKNADGEYGMYANNTWTWADAENAPLAAISGTNGAVSFPNLAEGTYTVEEIQAPAGYAQNLLPSFQITVGTNDTVTLDNAVDTNVLGLASTVGNGIQVKNVKSVTQLPLTGAAGITMLVVVALLIGGAAALIAVRSRSLKRQLNA